MGLLDDLGDLGGDLVDVTRDVVHVGGDVLQVPGEIVSAEVNALGQVVDATGKVLSATVDATGHVLDATGKVVGVVADYTTKGYPLLGPLGPAAYALDALLGGDGGEASATAQLAALGSGQPDADSYLDLASDCERLFSVWRPRMVAAGQAVTLTVDEAARMFDRERGMSFATLRQDQAHLVTTAATLHEAVTHQQQEIQTLASTWQSDGGAAAQTYLRTLAGVGDTTAGAVTTLASTYGSCTAELESAVKDKATSLLALYPPEIDGRSPAEVDLIIAAARSGSLSPDALQGVGPLLGFTFFGPLGGLAARLLDELCQHVQASAQEWLTSVLAPTYDQAVTSFTSICDDTTTSITRTYDVLTAALAGFDPAAFTPLDAEIPGPAPTPPPVKDTGGGGSGSGSGGGPGSGGSDAGSGSGGGSGSGSGSGGGGVTAGGPTSGPAPTVSASATPATPTTSAGVEPAAVPAGPPATAPTDPAPADPAPGLPTPGTTTEVRPAGLPGDSVWLQDATQLPHGWTVDPHTGEVLPPGAAGGAGDVLIDSPAGAELFDDDGVGDLGGGPGAPGAPVAPAGADPGLVAGPGVPVPGAETAAGAGDLPVTAPSAADGVLGSVVHVRDDGVLLDISASDGPGAGAVLTVTGADGSPAEYRIEIGADGSPQLVPVVVQDLPGADPTPAADAVGPTSAAVPAPDVAAPVEVAGLRDLPVADAFPPSSDVSPVQDAGPVQDVSSLPHGGTAPVAGEQPAAAVHSASWQGSWGEQGQGAELASTVSGAVPGAPADPSAGAQSGAQLAGTDGAGDGGGQGSDHGGGHDPVGAPGSAPHGALPPGGGGALSRTASWVVTEDTFADDAAPWVNLADVLGPASAREPGGRR